MGYLPRYEECYFCSPAGEGPRMRMELDGDAVISHFTVDPKFQGYGSIAHGGIVTGILDEIMWWVVFAKTLKLCFTLTIEAEFVRPVRCGVPLRAEGRLVIDDTSGIVASGAIYDQKGKLAARGKGTFAASPRISPKAFAEKLDFLDVSNEIRQKVLSALTR